jgi:5-methylcytosine-specific restriction endonuclease McrBC regulatory subunit McrC
MLTADAAVRRGVRQALQAHSRHVFERLHLIGLTPPAFQDLLADRLTAEAARLESRGLYRHYGGHEGVLPSPRGRILFGRLARAGPPTSALLPCRYFERDENVLANRVLLAGLQLAARVAIDPAIRARARGAQRRRSPNP